MFQLKATDSLRRSADGTVVPLRVEWRDWLFCLNDPAPVILVVYEAPEDRAYRLNAPEYFRGTPWVNRAGQATTVTVCVPAGNVLDEAAIGRLARFRDARGTLA